MHRIPVLEYVCAATIILSNSYGNSQSEDSGNTISVKGLRVVRKGIFSFLVNVRQQFHTLNFEVKMSS